MIGEYVVMIVFVEGREWSFSAIASQGFDGPSRYGNVWADSEADAVQKIGSLLEEVPT